MKALRKGHFKKQLRKLLQSKKAFAIPVTYLILFVSLTAIISATYSFAVVKINARGAVLNASVAKQNMQFLDDAVRSVAWSFGASKVVYIDDCGGVFKTEPTAKKLILNFSDEQIFHDIVFNDFVGKIFYELEPSESLYYGAFMRGDERAMINQSAYTMTQLYVAAEGEAQNIVLCYRPLATSAAIATSNGKPSNLIRINIINLNSSQNLMLKGKFYLKVTGLNVVTISKQYEFNLSVSSLAVKAVLNGASNSVWLPISSSSEGATVNLEIVICNVKIQRTEV